MRQSRSPHTDVGQGNPKENSLKEAKESGIHLIPVLAIPQNTKLTVITYTEDLV